VLVLLLFLGVPTVLAGLVLCGFVCKNRRRLGILALGMFAGLVVVGLGYRTEIAKATAIRQLAVRYQGAFRDLARQPAVKAATPPIGRLWLIALPLAPLIALYLESTRTRNVTEQREEQQRKERAQETE
jgi:hypothetical protein